MPPNELILHFFSQYIFNEIGIIYSESNKFQLESRLEEIVKLSGMKNLEQLYEKCRNGFPLELRQMLLDIATNNETSFFRDLAVFHALDAHILYKLLAIQKEKSDTIRIWSAASSTGQELVSLAILIQEFNERERKNLIYSALGTDISDRVLTKAKSVSYTQLEVQRGMPGHYLDKYFTKKEDKWVLNPQLSRYLEFKKLNLKDPFLFSPFHLILCRNVLIYQETSEKLNILRRLTQILLPGGYLILGVGESLLDVASEYETCNLDGTVFYQKRQTR